MGLPKRISGVYTKPPDTALNRLISSKLHRVRTLVSTQAIKGLVSARD